MSHKYTPKSINVVTLGCSKNLVDSEVLMRQISEGKLKVLHDSNEPTETVIINTCGFIADAKEESIDTILEFAAAKKSGLVKNIYVMGCLSERYKAELRKEIPEVDAYFGVNELPEILKSIRVDYKKELLGERLLTTPSHFAYLKIAEGCDRNCSFCAIPSIRGRHKSKSIQRITEEARFLAAQGVKELILISQDLSYYGVDIYKKQKLDALLKELVKIEGIEWIRLHYLYPASFPWAVIDLMKQEEKICNYIDIPLQHINDKILRSMKRGAGSLETNALIEKMRNTIPGAAIRTTFITGYPGEGPEEFYELKEFIRSMRFERVGIFTYSPEEGTPAEALGDEIPEEVKEQRREELMLIQEQISAEKNMELIDKNMKVIIDKKEGEYYVGRSQFDSPEVDNEVLIKSVDRQIVPGNFYYLRIIEADSFDLYGDLL